MPAPKKPSSRKQPAVSQWWNATVDVDTLSEQQQLAHQIVVRRRDLTPSVERIMNSEIDEGVRSKALSAFSVAIDTPGDPNRDPRVAITNASKSRS